ncbi:Kinesin light chain 3 [Rhizophlyctis rosea]|nr:Kinesin light chain 3 [Rhizophlyctis rosea]
MPTVIPGPVPLHGVRYSYLREFIIQCGDWAKLGRLTTAEVCEKFVKPRTDLTKSLCDHLALSEPHNVGQANVFISHTWRYKFEDLMDGIRHHFNDREEEAKSTILWIDIFSLPQHERPKIAADWLQKAFTDAISTIGQVIMIATPWDRPLTLTRAWCVYELLVAHTSKCTFHIADPERWVFIGKLIQDPLAFQRITSFIKSANSTASEADDLKAIRQAVRAAGGFDVLDGIIIEALAVWVADGWMELLHLSPSEIGHGSLPTLADISPAQGFGAAEDVFSRCYNRRVKELGEDHYLTVHLMTSMAIIYAVGERYDLSEQLLRECLKRTVRAQGEDHEWTMTIKYNIAEIVYLERKKYGSAEALLVECVDAAERSLRNNHRRSIQFKIMLAECYISQRKLQLAAPLCEDAGKLADTLPSLSHKKDLIPVMAKFQLGLLHTLRGRDDNARPLLEYCGQQVLSTSLFRPLNAYHPYALSYVHTLVALYMRMHEDSAAEKLLENCVKDTDKDMYKDMNTRVFMYKILLDMIQEDPAPWRKSIRIQEADGECRAKEVGENGEGADGAVTGGVLESVGGNVARMGDEKIDVHQMEVDKHPEESISEEGSQGQASVMQTVGRATEDRERQVAQPKPKADKSQTVKSSAASVEAVEESSKTEEGTSDGRATRKNDGEKKSNLGKARAAWWSCCRASTQD